MLRLTVDDGSDTVFDEVTIIVNNSSSAIYTGWVGGIFDKPFTDSDPSGNQGEDSLSN